MTQINSVTSVIGKGLNGDRDPIFFERMLNFSYAQAHDIKEAIKGTPKRYCKLLYRKLNGLQREQAFIISKLKEYNRT